MQLVSVKMVTYVKIPCVFQSVQPTNNVLLTNDVQKALVYVSIILINNMFLLNFYIYLVVKL